MDRLIEIEVFVRTAELGSVTEAAEKLALSLSSRPATDTRFFSTAILISPCVHENTRLTQTLRSGVWRRPDLSYEQMGLVLLAIGAGGTLGTWIMPALSDRIGRRPVMGISVAGALAALWMLSRTGPHPALLFVFLRETAPTRLKGAAAPAGSHYVPPEQMNEL